MLTSLAAVEADAVDAGVGMALSASVGARAATDVGADCASVACAVLGGGVRAAAAAAGVGASSSGSSWSSPSPPPSGQGGRGGDEGVEVVPPSGVEADGSAIVRAGVGAVGGSGVWSDVAMGVDAVEHDAGVDGDVSADSGTDDGDNEADGP